MALNRVSFDVEPGSHIGIVGRTGAGKSSILQTLMRITDLESGLILIDGVDIAQLPLRDLRRSIGVVPQSSALFEGTLHDNIDPFKQSSATDIEDVIETTRIKDVLGGLDSWVDNCGKNLSSGQQQLIGICRALLQNCKIFVLDEATANVDAATTKRIMSILRTKFKGCTVLIIAHRLETIESCDKILVMSDGQVVEFDTPAALKARGSQFAKLLKAGTEGASTKH
ncbi:multidrug resistance-associated protein 5-like protein [Coemansia spiralis]|nr:multidrug resistance-associated protein 5-like protein [Coemansia spiralis]